MGDHVAAFMYPVVHDMYVQSQPTWQSLRANNDVGQNVGLQICTTMLSACIEDWQTLHRHVLIHVCLIDIACLRAFILRRSSSFSLLFCCKPCRICHARFCHAPFCSLHALRLVPVTG